MSNNIQFTFGNDSDLEDIKYKLPRRFKHTFVRLDEITDRKTEYKPIIQSLQDEESALLESITHFLRNELGEAGKFPFDGALSWSIINQDKLELKVMQAPTIQLNDAQSAEASVLQHLGIPASIIAQFLRTMLEIEERQNESDRHDTPPSGGKT